MPRFLVAVALAVLAASLTGCQKPTGEQCERICWRYNELAFWERFETEAKNLAPDAREKLRAERHKAWAGIRARKFDPQLENCIRDCRRGASPDDVTCIEKARTTAEAKACPGLE